MSVTCDINKATIELNMDGNYTSKRWHKPQTSREKSCLIATAICAVLSLIFIITTIILAVNKDLFETPISIGDNVCLTSQCTLSAAMLLNSMNDKVDPCEDFYSFACGNWAKHYRIGENEYQHQFSLISDNINQELEELFKNLEVNDSSKVIKYAFNFYHSCGNLHDINRTYIFQKIYNILGFPFLNENNRKSKKTNIVNIYEIIAKTKRLLDIGTLFVIDIKSDIRNTTVNIITIHPPDYGELSEISFKDYGLQKLHQIIQDATGNNSTVEKLTIRQLNNITKYTHWLDIIQLIFEDNWIQFNITEEEIIQVENINYFINLFEKIKEKNITERTIVNYIVNCSAKYFLKDFNKFKILPKYSCLLLLQKYMSLVVDYIYFINVNISKTNTEEMIHYLKTAFKQLVANASWLDDQTRQYVYDKLEAMVPLIGYNSIVDNITAMEKYYENLEEITDDDLIQNSIKLIKFDVAKELSVLREYNNRTSWFVYEKLSGREVGASYNRKQNSIIFPAAVQQLPFYDFKRPWYLNFGAIGTVIGHEITHGFNIKDSLVDKYGNYGNDWWDSNTRKNFEEKIICFIIQYHNYKVTEINQTVNGITLGENIADNGGLRQAYRAYQNWVKEKGEDKLLPGVDFDSSQLFFLSFANMMCANYYPAMMEYLNMNDVHAINKYRVIGSLSNMEEFAQSFNCKKNSTMNPAKKCIIW